MNLEPFGFIVAVHKDRGGLWFYSARPDVHGSRLVWAPAWATVYTSRVVPDRVAKMYPGALVLPVYTDPRKENFTLYPDEIAGSVEFSKEDVDIQP